MKKRRLATVVLCFAAMLILGGCGVNHKSPEGIVKDLIVSYEAGKEKDIQECYGLGKKVDKDTQAEIDATIKYFKAHKPKDLELVECDIIEEYKSKGYTYVYVTYNLDLGNKKTYPGISTYFVNKKDKKYYVVPTKDVTPEMSQDAKTAYAAFMETTAYKEYDKAYQSFVSRYPEYEANIAEKLK